MIDLSSSLTLEENLEKFCVSSLEKGTIVEYICLSYPDYASLVVSLGAKTQFIELNEGDKTFEGIRFFNAAKAVPVIPDFNIPEGKIAAFGTESAIQSFYKLLKNNTEIKELK